MNLGPNEELVQEVVDFFESKQLEVGILVGELPIDPARFDITEDFGEAVWLSSSQDVWRENHTIWQDVRGWLISPVYYPKQPAMDDQQATQELLYERSADLDQHLQRNFVKRGRELMGDRARYCLEIMTEQISIDYHHIALARLQHGDKHEFYEQMFSAYQQGGWPCGWKGDGEQMRNEYMPQGKMVVYHVGPKV